MPGSGEIFAFCASVFRGDSSSTAGMMTITHERAECLTALPPSRIVARPSLPLRQYPPDSALPRVAKSETKVAPMSATKIALPNGSRIPVLHALPFALVHVACLAVFLVPYHWYYPVLAVSMYAGRMFWVTAGYHRYFSHRSFRTSRVFQFILAFMAMTSLQKGVLWWAAHHRHHHRYSDQEEDLHSPSQSGFWWSHVGWILADSYNQTRKDLIPDLYRYPELRWLDKYHAVPGVTLAVVLFLLGGWGAL